MMPKTVSLGFFAAVVLSLSLTACKDTKTLQENQQLKTQVAELQKENGQLGNDVETVTAARDALAKENSALQAELKQKRPGAKASSRKRRRSRKSQQS
jgi:outer membrane murein-binding lipoprotein Lpp